MPVMSQGCPSRAALQDLKRGLRATSTRENISPQPQCVRRSAGRCGNPRAPGPARARTFFDHADAALGIDERAVLSRPSLRRAARGPRAGRSRSWCTCPARPGSRACRASRESRSGRSRSATGLVAMIHRPLICPRRCPPGSGRRPRLFAPECAPRSMPRAAPPSRGASAFVKSCAAEQVRWCWRTGASPSRCTGR